MKIVNRQVILETDEENDMIMNLFKLISQANISSSGMPTKPGESATYTVRFAEAIDEDGIRLTCPYIEVMIENYVREELKTTPEGEVVH